MSDLFELIAEVRTDKGKGASRRLRRESNKVPAIIYGGKKEPMSLTFAGNKIKKALEHEGFYSHILTIDIDGKKEKAVLKALQRHPSKPQVLHMDLLRVTGKEAISMNVPLHFIGEDVAPGIKEGGVAAHTMTEVAIKCLPKDLPEFIEVDISQLEMDHAIHLSDLQLPTGVELETELDAEHDSPIVSIHVPRIVVEEEPTEEEEAEEGEAPEEAKPGEEPEDTGE